MGLITSREKTVVGVDQYGVLGGGNMCLCCPEHLYCLVLKEVSDHLIVP